MAAAVTTEAYPGQPLHERLTAAERDELGPYLHWRTWRREARNRYGRWLQEMCADAEAAAVLRQQQAWGRLATPSPLAHRWTSDEAVAAGRKSALVQALRKATGKHVTR